LQRTRKCRHRTVVADSTYALLKATVKSPDGSLPEDVLPESTNMPEVRALLGAVKQAVKDAKGTGGTLRFVHVYSHTGVPGNEEADKAADEARQRQMEMQPLAQGHYAHYEEAPLTGKTLHTHIVKVHTHRHRLEAKELQLPCRHRYLLSDLDWSLVFGGGAMAKLYSKVMAEKWKPALLKLRCGAIPTPDRMRMSKAAAEINQRCSCCKVTLQRCHRTGLPDLVGHLAYRCQAPYPLQLRGLREAELAQWNAHHNAEEGEVQLQWGDLSRYAWHVAGAGNARDSSTLARIDIRGLVTLAGGGLIRRVNTLGVRGGSQTPMAAIAAVVGQAAERLLKCGLLKASTHMSRKRARLRSRLGADAVEQGRVEREDTSSGMAGGAERMSSSSDEGEDDMRTRAPPQEQTNDGTIAEGHLLLDEVGQPMSSDDEDGTAGG